MLGGNLLNIFLLGSAGGNKAEHSIVSSISDDEAHQAGEEEQGPAHRQGVAAGGGESRPHCPLRGPEDKAEMSQAAAPLLPGGTLRTHTDTRC